MQIDAVKKMELLAPAGSLEVFETAVESGADAIYIGAPFLNARALAHHFTKAEIAAMVSHAHRAGVKVYAAMNSLLKEEEIPQAVETIAFLQGVKIDGLIVQDLGIHYLVKKYFPGLRIHASTLMTAHNSPSVMHFEKMGFERVVLSRELSVDEIASIRRNTRVELEAFVHGAMCFSYSGLCLFSSFLGGKSGLRGRCAQPCRRRYGWSGPGKGKKSGYYFSMNDLAGLELIPQLRSAGVGSLKIEGRMRTVQYVGNVIRAYRLAIDAEPGNTDAINEAKKLLQTDLGRKPFPGYFKNVNPANAISATHSGNTGIFLGRIKSVKGTQAVVDLRDGVKSGDRVRLHLEKSGDRHAFTLKQLKVKGKSADFAKVGTQVDIILPKPAVVGDSLYKVDLQARRQSVRARKIKPASFEKKVRSIPGREFVGRILVAVDKEIKANTKIKPQKKRLRNKPQSRRGQRGKETSGGQDLEMWVKVDDANMLRQPLPVNPTRILLLLAPDNYAGFSRMKISPAITKKLVLCLPPVIDEKDVPFYSEAIATLVGRGYKEWQLAHIGQLEFFDKKMDVNAQSRGKGRGGRVKFYGDYTLNVLNSLSFSALQKAGFSHIQLCIENDMDNLQDVARHCGKARVGYTIYGHPPLFTARLASEHFRYNTPFLSPKGEAFELVKRFGKTLAISQVSLSLLAQTDDLAALGINYGVIDLSNKKWKRQELANVFKHNAPRSRGRRVSSFNLRGKLL